MQIHSSTIYMLEDNLGIMHTSHFACAYVCEKYEVHATAPNGTKPPRNTHAHTHAHTHTCTPATSVSSPCLVACRIMLSVLWQMFACLCKKALSAPNMPHRPGSERQGAHAKGKLLSAEEKLETGRFERNRRTGDIPGARGMKKSTLWLWAIKDNVWKG